MKNTNRILLLIATLTLFAGCGTVYRVLLGVDISPNWKTDERIAKDAKKYKIPSEFNLVMDTVGFYSELRATYKNIFANLDIKDGDSTEYFKARNVLKDDGQPVQFRLFDKQGTEIFKMVNCYVDPPIPMSWNVDGCFDTFPAQTNIKSLNVHNFGIDLFLSNSTTLNKKQFSLEDLPEADYYGVILWNDFYIKPSKKLIKTVRKYIEDSNENVVLLYIHNHNSYLWQVMDAENKNKVKDYYKEEREKKIEKERKRTEKRNRLVHL
ncbi:hypothetical protein [Brumimicrobium mesophilum]|uniref:hypothetical protein n=1 Tax=Brumimicrobium mesophilum TaxID=392717 RepID=UPI000D141020|nr:hypothetical protein [Brumimicrobium mesophilum]